MSAPRVVAMASLLTIIMSGVGSAQSFDTTPSRLSYVHGEVSFWRPGAQDWAPAKLNTALEPGDALYAGQTGNAEIQIGPRAFVRAAEATQIGLDNQEPDFIQFRVTAGHVALDLRERAAGQTIEFDTPNAAFTVERAGYYRIDVVGDSVSFSAHRGGSAIMTPASGSAMPIAANQQAVVTGMDAPRVELGAAPPFTAWDHWNHQRTADLLRPTPARYVSADVYGVQELDRHGSWREVDTYGQVWVPSAVPANWVPYSMGRWIWDPISGWTWLDDAPWGWAPYHYGRWVFIGNVWAWTPGPIVVRPAYSPALVVFLDGPVGAGRPLAWAPLGWGEPLIPWWGRSGFAGVPWWGGWRGPRVVNNVVVSNTTIVNVQNITVYRNVHVVNAVVGVPAERFGRERVEPTRLTRADVQQLAPIRGALAVRPVATSVMPAGAAVSKPPAPIQERRIVSTRPPQDLTPILRAHGLPEKPELNRSVAPRLVPSPRSTATRGNAASPAASPPVSPGSTSGSAPNGVPTTVAPAKRPTNEAVRPSSPPPGFPRTVTPRQDERARPDAVVPHEPSGANAERRAPESASRSGQPQAGPSGEARPSSDRRPSTPPVRVEPGARGDRSGAEPPPRTQTPSRIGPQGNASPPSHPTAPQLTAPHPTAPQAGPSREASRPSASRPEAPPARVDRPSRGEPAPRSERAEQPGHVGP